MKKIIKLVPRGALVFVQVDCPIVEPVETLVSKLKDQKVIIEMKKVVKPIQGEVWVFVQEDHPIIKVETLVLKPMGQVMRKMDEVNITSSTMKNATQLLSLTADIRERGLQKIMEDISLAMRVVDKDHDKLYAKANLNVRTTSVIKELIEKKVLSKLAYIRPKMKDMQAVREKKKASFGVKGKDNGTNADYSGENGGNVKTNDEVGGLGLMGMLKNLRDLILRSRKDDEDYKVN